MKKVTIETYAVSHKLSIFNVVKMIKRLFIYYLMI